MQHRNLNVILADFFPDASLEGASNFCRNPDGREGGVWCYTQNADLEWEFCDLDTCPGSN